MPRYTQEVYDSTRDLIRLYERVVEEAKRGDSDSLETALITTSLLNKELREYPDLIKVSYIDAEGFPHYYVEVSEGEGVRSRV